MSPSFEVKDFYFSHLGLPWVSKAGLRVNNQEMWACRNKEQLLGGGTGNNLDYIHQLYHWTPTSLKDIKVWHTFPSCFYRNWTPTRWKLLTKSCRSQTSWNHKIDEAGKFTLMSTNPRSKHQLLRHPAAPYLPLPLKTLPWKPLGS